MGGVFVFDNYHIETKVKVLYRIGDESEYFKMLDQARIQQKRIDNILSTAQGSH